MYSDVVIRDGLLARTRKRYNLENIMCAWQTRNLIMKKNYITLLLQQSIMQIKHETDLEYNVTTCLDETEMWCVSNLYLYYPMEPSRSS